MFSKLERFPKNKNTLAPPVGAYDPKFPDGSHGPVSFKRSPRDKETKVVGPGVGYYDPKYPNYKIKSNHNFSKLISSAQKSKSTNSSTHNITLSSGKKLLDKRRRSKSVENLTASVDDDLENTISLETSTVSEDYSALVLEVQDLKDELHRKTEELEYRSKIFLNKTNAEQQTDSFANTINSFSVNMDFVNQLKIVGSELCCVKKMQNAVQADFNDLRMNISNVLPNFSVESLLSSIVKNHTRELRERFTALDSAHESLMKEFHEVCRQLSEKCDETMVIRRENDALAVELATCFQKIDRLSVGEIDGGSRLENLRREFDDERHSYMETISSLRSFLEESNQSVDFISRQLREKYDETTEIRKEKDALAAELASCVEKIDSLSVAKTDTEIQLEHFRREFADEQRSYVETISSLTASLAESNRSVDLMNLQIREKNDETTAIRKEKDDLAAELASCVEKIDSLSVAKTDTEIQLEHFRREFADEQRSYVETISSLTASLAESNRSVDLMNFQICEKNDETTAIRKEKDDLAAELASCVEKIDSLSVAKTDTEIQLENFRREFADEQRSYVDTISSLTASLAESNRSVDLMNLQIREKNDETTAIRKEKDDLATELASCVEKIDSLSVAKTDTEIQLENFRREFADEQRSYVETISSLTASVAESNLSVDLMSLQIREKNDETTAIRKEKDDLAAELASCVEKIDNLIVAKLDSENRLENVCHEFDDHRRSLLEKISSLTSSLEEANKSVDYLNEVRKGFDAILVEADEQLFKVMSERACLENKLACFKRNFEENATVEIRELKSEHVRLNVELAKFRLALSDTFDRLKESLINSVQNYNKNVESEKVCLINEVNCMLKLVNETKGALFEEKAKLSKMDHDFQQISESLNATKEEITQIRTENEQYVKRQTELEEQLKSTQSLLDAALADVRETKLRQIDFDECKRALESEKVDFKRSLEMLTTTKDEFVSQICNENDQLLKEKSELEEQLKSTQKWLEDTRVDVRETKTNLFALVESHKALCERCDALLQSKKEQADAYQRERILLEVREREFDEMLKEIMEKYTALMSHQNHKQKILHVVKLKDICLKTRQENMELRKENQKSKAHIDSLQDKLDKIQGKRRFDPALAFRACGKENATPLKSVENHK